jgi:soluble lytic murein transglycosylase-like protein
MRRFARTMVLVSGFTLLLAGCTPKENAALIRMYAAQYGVDATTMLGIASCESNFRDDVINRDGEWNYGLFQFSQSTYNWARRAYFGGDNPPGSILNPAYNASTAAAVIRYYGLGPWTGDPYLRTGRFCVPLP